MRKCYTLSFILFVYLLRMYPAHAQTLPTASVPEPLMFTAAYFQDMSWRNIGPFQGGRANSAAGVRGDNLTYFMGTVGGGIWKTTDAGLSWFNISDGFFSSASIGEIAISNSDPNVIYAGSGEHAVRGVMSNYGDGVYKTTDGGQTWSHIGLAGTRHIAGIAIHPNNPDYILVAAQGAVFGPSTERGIYLSEDGGKTWEKTLYINETTGASDIVINPANPRIIYATLWDHARTPWSIRSGGPGSGIFKSIDGGKNWTKLTSGLPEEMGKVGISISPVNPLVLYAIVEAEQGGVYRSRDGGRNWIATCTDRVTWARSWYYMEIEADPVDEQTVYVLNAPLLKSIDGGRNFDFIETPHTDHHDLWINPADPKNMIIANDGGASISFNGGLSWSTQENQPTAQLYRVITDNRFPYHLYAGQQDYSTIAIPSRSKGYGIHPNEAYEVGGGESAFITFDPDNPRLIYGSSYQGSLTVYDHITKESKNIAAYPTVGIASTPQKNKYRFNWNAPVVANAQDPTTIYHAGNKVLVTSDGGYNWREISPDLTRNELEKQGQGGGPFTNEGAGAEVYNTISYLSSSPHDKQTLWTGSDDGLVFLTTDGGENWNEVTPPDLEEALINCIEVSPHDESTVYLVATRHKFNDLSPIIYKSNDLGSSWMQITSGIASTDFVRVVREDPRSPKILYAGTQNGMYISLNQGQHWSRFQLNLPVTPITDLTFAENDLVASTAGRGFWILDDLNPIQQTLGYPPVDDIVLIEPEPVIRYDHRSTPDGIFTLGKNPEPGVIIDYFLPAGLDSTPVELVVYNELTPNHGPPVRMYSSDTKLQKEYAGGPEQVAVLPVEPGHNRFNWDVRRKPLPSIEDIFILGDYRGGMVAPGAYRIELRTPSDTLSTTVSLESDPRIKVPIDAYQQQQDLLEGIEGTIRDIHTGIRQMNDIRRQISTLIRFLKDDEKYTELVTTGETAISSINHWERGLIQYKHRTEQDVINYEHKLTAEFMSLKETVDSANPRITSGTKARYNDLSNEWGEYKLQMQDIMDIEVRRFNQIFKSQNLPALILPKVESFD